MATAPDLSARPAEANIHPPGESGWLTREAVAALKALADEGTIPAAKVAEAIAKYGLDPEKPAPWTV